MIARRIEILLGVRRCSQQLSVNVGRSERVVLDVGISESRAGVIASPVVIFHQNDPYRLYFAHLCVGWRCEK